MHKFIVKYQYVHTLNSKSGLFKIDKNYSTVVEDDLKCVFCNKTASGHENYKYLYLFVFFSYILIILICVIY